MGQQTIKVNFSPIVSGFRALLQKLIVPYFQILHIFAQIHKNARITLKALFQSLPLCMYYTVQVRTKFPSFSEKKAAPKIKQKNTHLVTLHLHIILPYTNVLAQSKSVSVKSLYLHHFHTAGLTSKEMYFDVDEKTDARSGSCLL